MSLLDAVRAKRQKLVDVLRDEDYSGIRDIVENLYPDRAHFIYELLQNAEDTGARSAYFELERDRLRFEHDGRQFDEKDVWGITNIGKGTKREDEDSIGRFGIGFKAVFAYCDTPRIWSPPYCFEIADLVMPCEIDPVSARDGTTRFEFPFNNPKKRPDDAFREIRDGLEELTGSSLLHLKHLTGIHWTVDGKVTGSVSRLEHSANHVEVRKSTASNESAGQHLLYFRAPVNSLPSQSVAIAFELEFITPGAIFDLTLPLRDQMRVVPAAPGRVSISFPADKETSGLRFHVHAPFVPELSRASVKETAANDPLFKQLAQLAAESLVPIKEYGLLDGEFLAVLPNLQDQVPARYGPIRRAIIETMTNEPLTPTFRKSHAPARQLVQGRPGYKQLFSDYDLSGLFGYPRQWVIGTRRSTDQERFLASLTMESVANCKAMTDMLALCMPGGPAKLVAPGTPGARRLEWHSAQPAEWFQRLFALLHTEAQELALPARQEYFQQLRWSWMVRTTDGSFRLARECFFADEGIEVDGEFPRVDPRLYTSDGDPAQQKAARAFLVEAGVGTVDDTAKIKSIIKTRYQTGATEQRDDDLIRFVELAEADPSCVRLFKSLPIFKCTDGVWRSAQKVYLDVPFVDSGLHLYYERTQSSRRLYAISDDMNGVAHERIKRFAEQLGVSTHLPLRRTSCDGNPEWAELQEGQVYKQRWDRHDREDVDWDSEEIEELLSWREVEASRLVWRTLIEHVNAEHLVAVYQRNNHSPIRSSQSQLVHRLRSAEWVPQKNGDFLRPSEAVRSELPEGFPCDTAYSWMSAVQFGATAVRSASDDASKRKFAELGFADEGAVVRAREFAQLPEDVQKRILEEAHAHRELELPTARPSNPERRSNVVADEAERAPERATEVRERSVSVGLDAVKLDSDTYLRQQYTNDDDIMICQICKKELPFKLANGDYYFEKVEFLKLARRHYQNYLSLCPNHAAMYLYANESRDALKEAVDEVDSERIPLRLAGTEHTIYFTETHLGDIRVVLRVDGGDDLEGS